MPNKEYNAPDMSTRREFLTTACLGTAALVLPLPIFNYLFTERNPQPSPEWEKDFDGQTVWEARNMPIYILDRGTGKTLYTLTLDGVDCQMIGSQLGKKVMIQPDLEINPGGRPPNKVTTREIYSLIPTVTGMPAKYVTDAGFLSGREAVPSFFGMPYPKNEALASYLVVGRFYDNKTVNAFETVLSLAQNSESNPIPPAGEYSYIQATKTKELELANDGKILMGKGLVPSTEEEGKYELDDMFGGGICISVAAIAKAARQAETRGLVKITERTPHTPDPSWWYWFNPDDPTPKQVDATVNWQTNTDFKFRNKTKENLFVVPKGQIITDPDNQVPRNYNGLEHTTAFFVLSTTLRTTPSTKAEIASLENELVKFRQRRKI